MKKIHYWNRIFQAYIIGRTSHVSFWRGEPKINPNAVIGSLGPYYMLFDKKAEYEGHHDDNGIPMLHYQGKIGLNYNPIAIAQWGLGNYNKWCELNEQKYYDNFIKSADWLASNLEKNIYGLEVWMHHFDFEYRDTLKSPWYSGLAQGQGISLLLRALNETKNQKYSKACQAAFQSFLTPTHEGGVNYLDSKGNNWIEEYIVHPPTHILNGFIWALWGIYEYANYYKDEVAVKLFNDYTNTLIKELDSYDIGYWSLYEHSGTNLKMIASSFYHKLHIVQLRVMFNLTNEETFNFFANKWNNYLHKTFYKKLALIQKIIFKVIYY